MPPLKVLAVSLLLTITMACTSDDGDQPPSTAAPSATATPSVATETATPLATAQPSATPDATHLTGDAFIDRVIEATKGHDITALRSMVRLQETQCVSAAEGLGGPPLCKPDEPDGSTVAVFPVSSCEGAFTRYPGATLGSFVSAARGLYAVTESSGEPRSVPYWPVGDTYVVFHADRAGNDPGERLVLEDGAIVAVWFGCGSIEDTLSWRGEPLPLMVGPFDERTPAPPGPPLSGIEGVDEVIIAVTNYDLAALHERTAPATVPCVDPASDASEVACNPAKGEVPGDAVAVLPIVYCDGELSRDRLAIYTELLDLLPRAHALQHSLTDAPDDRVWLNGTYLLTLELAAPAGQLRAAQLVLDDRGRIVVVRYNCGASVGQLLERGGVEIPLTARSASRPQRSRVNPSA